MHLNETAECLPKRWGGPPSKGVQNKRWSILDDGALLLRWLLLVKTHEEECLVPN